MQFDSFTFFIFLLVVLALYQVLPTWRSQKLLLLIASYGFYAAWSPPLVVLIWISTLTDFIIARRLNSVSSDLTRRILLTLSLAVNLGLLAYFKYADFLLHNFQTLAAMVGIVYSPPALDIILPIGISFYTFQTLSYTIDVYRRRLTPTASLLDFSLFVTFFPQLVAGPIVRAGDFLPQCETRKRLGFNTLTWGFGLIAWGLFQKIVLADKIFAPLVDSFFAEPMKHAGLEAWLAVTSFSMQIYCDFAGYSLCAVGAAVALGFSLPDNFNAPYAAAGFSDFWRRWHMTLSLWLRDYLYISLGGNRKGRILTVRNLFVTMLLGGLWHGASWNFAFWGSLHGLFLGVENGLRQLTRFKPSRSLLIAGTFVVVTVTWIPFRSPDWSTTLLALQALWSVSVGRLAEWPITHINAALTIAVMLAYQFWRRDKSLDELMAICPAGIQGALLALAVLSIAVSATGDSHAFIYFQF
jgi:alginate O-acetyltransferase complex protein AlgI